MAMRLLRSLHRAPPDSAGLVAMIEHHLTEGAFEDWARRHLPGWRPARWRRGAVRHSVRRGARAAGTAEPGVCAPSALVDDCAPRIGSRCHRALSDQRPSYRQRNHVRCWCWCSTPWTPGSSKSSPTAWMSAAGRDSAPSRPAALAVVPTVTQVSRMALFSGKVTQGSGAHEKSAFAEHPALRDVSQRGRPPRLFHKADLVDGATLALAAAVREALGDQRQRVVGIVLNAVDDHLAKSEQLGLAWGIDSVRFLLAILHEAHAAGRVVVLTSDHGHVLDAGGVKLAGNVEARWRTADHPANELEIQLEGERVRAATGRERIIVPWSETVRYSQKKNGYHGGLTLQETVVPVGIFVGPGDRLPDSKPWPPEYPSWWSGEEPSRKPARRSTPKPRPHRNAR